MILLRCLNCLSHRIALQSSERFYLLNCSTPRVLLNEQFRSGIYCSLTLQHKSCFSTSPLLLKKKKPKGWKEIADDTEVPLRKYACERGKDAVPHSDLVSKLQKCSSVSEQIVTFSSVLSLTNTDQEKRNAFCKWLEDLLKFYVSDFKLHQFGSSVTGMGFKGCDLDVCLLTKFNENAEENITIDNVPTPEDVESGQVSQETIARFSPLPMTKFLKCILEKHPDISDVVRINGRCPILKFYSVRHDIFCDLCFQNQFSLQNTALIKFLGKLDERFLVLLRIVRYWGKHCGLVDGLDKFSSYAFALFVIHFLQTRDPPVLPPLNEIITKSVFVQQGRMDDTHLLFEDLKKFSPSNNSMSVEELLKGFFFYYLYFSFDQVIVPATGCSVMREDFDIKFEFNTINIQDPFKTNANITVGTQYDICKLFWFSLKLTCEAFQNDLFSSPGLENSGLCSLFLKPLFIAKKLKEFQENTLHTIEVPSIPNAAYKVKEILEYGLLFNCISFKPTSIDSSSSSTLLKIRCKAYNKTWLGRDLLREKISVKDNLSPLQREHLISKEITAKSDIKKRQILCEFECECKETLIANEAKLIVHLNFKKASPLGVFLKDYIPCTLKML